MSLRDLNESSRPLNTDPAGNSAGLNSFHTINPEEREPSHTPQIVGAIAVVLMVGAAAVGLYAYSGSPHPKPAVADNSLPQPPAPPPAAQQAAADTNANANTPADTMTPAATAAANNSTPDAAPAKEASSKPARLHRHHGDESGDSTLAGAAPSSSQTASNGASVRMSADSTKTGLAPAQENAVQAPSQQATPLPSTPQPSPSDVAANNAQSGQVIPQSATTASDLPAQSSAAQQQPAQPAAQQSATPADTAPAPAQ